MPGPSFTFQEKAPTKRGLFGQLGLWLLLSLILLLLVFAAWGGSMLLRKVFTDRQEAIKAERNELIPKWPKTLERDILQFPAQVKLAEKVTKDHIYGSKFFDFLRLHTLKRVFITSVDVSRGKGTGELKVNGEAADFRVLAEQLVLLKSLKELSETKISGITLKEGGLVGFTLTMKASPAFFMSSSGG